MGGILRGSNASDLRGRGGGARGPDFAMSRNDLKRVRVKISDGLLGDFKQLIVASLLVHALVI